MNRTPSRLEQSVSTGARILLRGVRPGEDVPCPDVMSKEPRDRVFYGLVNDVEYFIQEVIREVEYCGTLDGLIPYRVRKLAPLEADVVGVCWYIVEQRLAPFYVQFRVARHAEQLEWCYCCLGELGPHGEITWPGSSTTVGHKVARRLHQIRWKHCVEYGERGATAPMPSYS